MFPMKCYIFCSAATGPDQLLDSLLLLTARQKKRTPPIEKRIGSRELAANLVTIKLCWFDELCWFPSINPYDYVSLHRITTLLLKSE